MAPKVQKGDFIDQTGLDNFLKNMFNNEHDLNSVSFRQENRDKVADMAPPHENIAHLNCDMLSPTKSKDSVKVKPLTLKCPEYGHVNLLNRSLDSIESKCRSEDEQESMVLIVDDQMFFLESLLADMRQLGVCVDYTSSSPNAIKKVVERFSAIEKGEATFQYRLIFLRHNLTLLDGAQTCLQIQNLFLDRGIDRRKINKVVNFCSLHSVPEEMSFQQKEKEGFSWQHVSPISNYSI